jgi:RNA polymerase sigma-70 factor, ECF subfamily
MSERVADFQAIHEAYRPKLLRYLTRLVGASSAEDLVQQVFLKVSAGLKDFRGDAKLSTWIYRIATNSALDHLRRAATTHANNGAAAVLPTPDGNRDLEELDIAAHVQSPSAETISMQNEMNACIREFVERLPENYKTVLALSELEGFTNSEIADILDLSLDTAKIRLHRARERLRQELEAGCSFHRDERNEFACDRKA